MLFVSKNILIRIIKAGFYLTAYDRSFPRVRFETSGSLFAIVQFMFAQDIKSGWRSSKGIKKPSLYQGLLYFRLYSRHCHEISNKNICIK